MQAALLLGPYNPADTMVLEVPTVTRDAVRNLWQGPLGEEEAFGIWDPEFTVIYRQLFFL